MKDTQLGSLARNTTCVLDCPDTCHLEVEVAGGRITRIGPAKDPADTPGFICSKVAGFHRRIYHQDRLLRPMRRTGAKGEGRFEAISWQEAIDEITSRFQEIRRQWGGEAILPFHYGGSNGVLSDGLLDALYFSRLGASRLAKTICATPTTLVALGMYGKMPGVAFEDFVHARSIVVWGANPKASNIHLVPYLRQAKEKGAFIATVDPRRNFSSHEIDLHLPVLPGQDLPVALAMIRFWEEAGCLDSEFLDAHAVGLDPLLEQARRWSLEEAGRAAGVEAGDIRRLAQAMAEKNPCVVRCGWGLERNRNGGQAVAAVLSMPALLGKFGVRGGGYTLSNGGSAGFDRRGVTGPLGWSTRSLNMTQLGRLLRAKGATGVREDLDPPIKGLFVYNANPVATVPNQQAVVEGLSRQDLFTVVFEQVMTDTAPYADLLLPAATFLEAHDLRLGYGAYVAGGLRPVIPAQGEARSNMEVFAALGRAMGFEDEAFTWDDDTVLRRAAACVRLPNGPAQLEKLAAGGRQSYDYAGSTPIQFDTITPATPDGKIHLTPEVLGPRPYDWIAAANTYPLALITPASGKLITSTLGEVHLDTLEVTLHPSEAKARGLAGGDGVRVSNAQGEVHCTLRLSDGVRPGVASMPKGAWRRSSLNGATSTALCPDDVQVVGGAACFNDARVEVEALAQP